MNLASLISRELLFAENAVEDRNSLFETVATNIARVCQLESAADLVERLAEREALGSTAVGQGVAIPHCKIPGLTRVILSVVIVPGGIDYGALDGSPVHTFFFVLSPESSPASHLQCLAAISKWIKSEDRGSLLQEIDSIDELWSIFQDSSA